MEFKEAIGIYGETEYAGLLVDFVKLLKTGTYVELGVRRGYTFNKVSPFVKRAVAVDMREVPGVVKLPHVEVYTMTTSKFSRVWKDPIDLLFIDACHNKESVLEDFRLFVPFVREDLGVIALHDTYPMYKELLIPTYCSNAWEAIQEIKDFTKNRRFEIFTVPGPFAGITFVRKVTKSLIWM